MNAKQTIEKVWNEVKDFGGIIAGGCVADAFFGKDIADIDVFIPSEQLEQLEIIEKLIALKFQEVGEKPIHTISISDVDHYGHEILTPNRKNKIMKVYKGVISDINVDLVFVHDQNVREHIDTFDLNIKRCYYDGELRYSEAFMKDITNNTVTANYLEPIGYIRAKKAADKYGMEISEEFELSRQYLAFLKEKGQLERITKKYRDDVEMMDLGDYEIHKIQAFELFQYYQNNDETEYIRQERIKRLTQYMKKDVQSYHPITKMTFTVKVVSSFYAEFSRLSFHLSSHLLEWTYRAKDKEESEQRYQLFEEYIRPLRMVTEEEFKENKIRLVVNHKVRIMKLNKFIQKAMKKLTDFKISFSTLYNLVEQRSTIEEFEVSFSARTKDLLEISTNKGWTSCQRWEPGQVNHLNVKTLGNLGGATVVGIFRIPGEEKWEGRFLVRVGEDNTVFFENIYTHRAGLSYGMSNIFKQLTEQLRAAGIKVVEANTREFIFRSLPMSFIPYNNVYLCVKDEDPLNIFFYTYGYLYEQLDPNDREDDNYVLIEDDDDEYWL